MSEATVRDSREELLKNPGYYVCVRPGGSDGQAFKVMRDGTVWGLSFYEGSWGYRTYGRGVSWFLENIIGEDEGVRVDRDRMMDPPPPVERPGLIGQYDPSSPFEPIKIIEHYNLNFNLGNVVKYVLRAGKKPGVNDIEDLEKARQYIEFEIARRKQA